ncbi:hypothetical protein NKR23_g3382 [Pleurostoma richardsiae]|uniref:Uncharacterized protein n=1 Tax=Pleurostoma richardsiae TaxID=41990 RepID=A0AA38RZ27_9PEZI|nr:hypothetical protein NKR23_g3382 [Pleurostoma richardsiae]
MRHPWVTQNLKLLDDSPDPAGLLCDLSSPLRTGGNDDQRYPVELFRKLRIDNNELTEQRAGWKNAAARLLEIKACPAALEDVQGLHVDVFVHESGEFAESLVPGDDLPALFADVLSAMPNLSMLYWNIPVKATKNFEKSFVQSKLVLPSVRHLTLGPYSDFLVVMSPNLDSLNAGTPLSWNRYMPPPGPIHFLLQSAAESGIQNLSIYNRNSGGSNAWGPELVQQVMASCPNLTSFTMSGFLQSTGGYHYGAPQGGTQKGSQLKAILAVLSRFPRLEHLGLPSAEHLDLDFDGGPFCGNAFEGAQGRAFGRVLLEESLIAMEFAANMTMAALPQLKSLSIGLQQPNLMKNETGETYISWPWTGRIEEYVHEIYPEVEDGDNEQSNNRPVYWTEEDWEDF